MHYQCSGVDYDAGSGEDPAPDLRGSIGYILRVRIRTMQRVGDVRDGDTPCVAYSNHGRKRQVITVVGDSEKNTVRVYDSQGNLVKPVLTKAPSKKD